MSGRDMFDLASQNMWTILGLKGSKPNIRSVNGLFIGAMFHYLFLRLSKRSDSELRFTGYEMEWRDIWPIRTIR